MDKEFLPRDKKLKNYANELRNNPTKQENRIWYDFLRKHSVQFYRQGIIGDYIVDFFCPSLNLVVEIDGAQHYEAETIQYDSNRTEYLEGLGLEVVRITNGDIDRNFLEACMMLDEKIAVLSKLLVIKKV